MTEPGQEPEAQWEQSKGGYTMRLLLQMRGCAEMVGPLGKPVWTWEQNLSALGFGGTGVSSVLVVVFNST